MPVDSLITDLGPGPELMTRDQTKLARQIPVVDLREEVHRQARIIADPPPSDDAVSESHWLVTESTTSYKNAISGKIERTLTEREVANRHVWNIEDKNDEIFYFIDKYKRDLEDARQRAKTGYYVIVAFVMSTLVFGIGIPIIVHFLGVH